MSSVSPGRAWPTPDRCSPNYKHCFQRRIIKENSSGSSQTQLAEAGLSSNPAWIPHLDKHTETLKCTMPGCIVALLTPSRRICGSELTSYNPTQSIRDICISAWTPPVPGNPEVTAHPDNIFPALLANGREERPKSGTQWWDSAHDRYECQPDSPPGMALAPGKYGCH